MQDKNFKLATTIDVKKAVHVKVPFVLSAIL